MLFRSFGEPTAETKSLRALRQLVKEALDNKGAQFTLSVSEEIKDWLEAKPIDWESDLKDRIGPRYTIASHSRNGFSVQADR